MTQCIGFRALVSLISDVDPGHFVVLIRKGMRQVY